MKFILALIFSFASFVTIAQQHVFKISVQKQILSIHLNEDNSNKKITIDTKGRIANVQRFSIRSLYPELDANTVRVFQVVENGDQDALITFTDEKQAGVFNQSLKDVADKLKTGKTYNLYTIAVPKDPAEAAKVKARRVLVAAIELQ
jgi:hypothetical protein